jgi:hypothetical protein
MVLLMVDLGNALDRLFPCVEKVYLQGFLLLFPGPGKFKQKYSFFVVNQEWAGKNAVTW